MSLHKLLIKAAEDRVTVEILLDRAIAQSNGNIAQAARSLGVSRQAIYLRLAKRATSREIVAAAGEVKC